MSASNWESCPRCEKNYKEKIKRRRAEVSTLYGLEVSFRHEHPLEVNDA